MAKGFGSRTSRIKERSAEYECVGGPYAGKKLRLSDPPTLPFRTSICGLGRYAPPIGNYDYGKLHWERIKARVPCPCCGTIVDEEKVK